MKAATLVLAVTLAASPFFAHASSSLTEKHRTVVGRDSSEFYNGTIQDQFAEIMHVIGLQPNFELKAANVKNIEAVISHRKRYIYYNPAFINQVSSLDHWGTLALLAHEIGHHLNGHTLKKGGSSPELELEADQFAGFVLKKLGATLMEAQSVMTYIANEESSATHPGRASRTAAIERGWSNAARR
jgi:hypothetical protein